MNKVLVIEDETDLREDIIEELRESGFNTIEASNGREGLQAIIEHSPDLILCDRKMPLMSGLELLKMLRRNHPEYSRIPFVFVSALADPTKIMASDLQPSAYITKPVDFESLVAMVKHLVD